MRPREETSVGNIDGDRSSSESFLLFGGMPTAIDEREMEKESCRRGNQTYLYGGRERNYQVPFKFPLMQLGRSLKDFKWAEISLMSQKLSNGPTGSPYSVGPTAIHFGLSGGPLHPPPPPRDPGFRLRS